jgi:hypothetical protein
MGALGAALCLSARTGSSEPDKADKAKVSAERRACGLAYRAAIQLEQSAHLRQAKDQLLACSKASCGAVIKQRCTSHYAQLEADIPSVVPLVSDENGEPRTDVQVSIDNEVLTSKIDGRSLPVDPGVHEFSFTADGSVLATQKIMIVQGQRNRPISVSLQKDKHGKRVILAPTPGAPALDAKASLDKPGVDKDRQALEKNDRETPPPDKAEKAAPESAASEKAASEASPDAPALEVKSKGGPGAMPYLLGTIGLAGLGGAGLLTYWGRKDNESLAQCSPDCSQASVDHIRKLYLASDISLGVGAAALVTSVIWFIAAPSSKEKPPSQASYQFDVRPAPAGGFATVSGRF